MDKQGGFDAVAKYYDRLARLVFGKSLLRSQTIFLNKILPSSKVLVLGGGTGWWLKKFLEGKPDCRIVYVDSSNKMLKLARKAAEEDSRIYFIHGTERSITEVNEFDAVITFCFFDLFTQNKLPAVINKIKTSMKPKSLWLAMDFIEESWWHSVLLSVMYLFFKITTKLQNQKLPDWRAIVLQNNLKELDHEILYGGFIKTAVYEVNK